MRNGKDRADPPVGGALGRLLEAERVTPAAPAELRARVMSRACRALSQPLERPSRRTGTARARFVVATGVLVAGAGALAGMHRGWMGRPEARSVALPAFGATASAPAAPATFVPAALPVVESPQPARAAPRTPLRARDFKVELELLDQAQHLVTAGRFEAAVALLEAHARRFPNGALVEEREAMRIRALSRLGRIAEARQAAVEFRRRFPLSVLGERVGETRDASD